MEFKLTKNTLNQLNEIDELANDLKESCVIINLKNEEDKNEINQSNNINQAN